MTTNPQRVVTPREKKMSLDYCRGLYEADSTLHVFKMLCVVFLIFISLFIYVVRLLLFQLAVCRLFSLLFTKFNKPSWMKDWSNACIVYIEILIISWAPFDLSIRKFNRAKTGRLSDLAFIMICQLSVATFVGRWPICGFLTTNYRLYFKFQWLVNVASLLT